MHQYEIRQYSIHSKNIHDDAKEWIHKDRLYVFENKKKCCASVVSQALTENEQGGSWLGHARASNGGSILARS